MSLPAKLSLPARFSLGFAFAVLAPPALAETITVGPDLQLYDFAHIYHAVEFAKPGDTILVAPGDYQGFELVGKDLTILGAGSGLSRITSTYAILFAESGSIRVSSVNQGRVRIGGFSLEPAYEPINTPVHRWLSAVDCAASVEFFDIEIPDPQTTSWGHSSEAPSLYEWSYGIVAASNCRQLMLSDVRVTGYADKLPAYDTVAPPILGTIEGYTGLSAYDSFVWCSNCHFEGCSGPNCQSDQLPVHPLRSGSGARLWNTRLVASNSTFLGARGLESTGEFCIDLEGGAGIELKFASQVVLSGGPNAAVLGGDSTNAAAGGYGVRAYGPASVIYTTDTAPVGGSDLGGQPAPAIQEIGANLVQVISLDEVRPSMVASASLLQMGDSVDLQLYGNPDGLQVVLWDTHVGSQLPSPLIVGDLFLDPSSASMLGVYTLDGAGQGTASLQVPLGPEFLGVSIALQTTELIHPLFYPAPPTFLATGL